MKCVEEGCGGEIDLDNSVLLKTSCGPPSEPAFLCKKCGRLHWGNGEGANNRGGAKAFIIDGNFVADDGEKRIVL